MGTFRIANQNRIWRDFESARKLARSLNLKSWEDWNKWIKSNDRPKDILQSPNRVYKYDGYIDIGDWLGTGVKASWKINYRDFKKARAYARSLNLKSSKEWKEFAKTEKKPDDIPASPSNTYKNLGWKGMPDWLGTDTVAPQHRTYRSFTKVKKYFIENNITSESRWRIYKKENSIPLDIPRHPDRVYKRKNEWKGWADFLGKED